MVEETNHNNRSKPYLNSSNVPINGKLNVALRHHGRIGGLGPCLEERQMNVIDKIWGNFKSDQESSQSKLQLTSSRNEKTS